MTKTCNDSELRFWALFAVVLALLSQVVFPPQVMAAQTADGPRFILCDAGFDGTAIADPAAKAFGSDLSKAGHKGFNGLKCADCIVATVTAVVAQAQVFAPVIYVTRAEPAPLVADTRSVKARAPPRPHSCGPPASVRA